jgi:hypothetical protein
MRGFIIVTAAALLLAACATRSAEPRIVTRTVGVPIAIACAPAVERPGLPATTDAIAAAADIDALARLYRADWLLARAYIAALEAAVRGCGG